MFNDAANCGVLSHGEPLLFRLLGLSAPPVRKWGPRHGLGAGRRQTPLQHLQPDGFGRGYLPRPWLHGVGGLDADGPVGLVVTPVLNSVEVEEMAASATHL